ncbi:hypothetical protein [Nocardia terrae]|nr:hypothetical protein [Nocardia terrae]
MEPVRPLAIDEDRGLQTRPRQAFQEKLVPLAEIAGSGDARIS